jgi:RING finger family protein/alpha-aminoadipate carrier LysW-like protein
MAVQQATCPGCGHNIALAELEDGSIVICPACQAELRAPETTAAPMAAADAFRPIVCAICLSTIENNENRAICPECRAEYHSDCWQENGGCAVYGCAQVPTVDQRSTLEIPVSYWGQENKPCPVCRREILAVAVRCRHCGATFTSARPQDSTEFQQRAELEQRLPAIRQTVIWLFIFCALPCLAPIGAIWGLIWYPRNREAVRALPALYAALCKIGLGVGIGQTVILVLMALTYAVVRGTA